MTVMERHPKLIVKLKRDLWRVYTVWSYLYQIYIYIGMFIVYKYNKQAEIPIIWGIYLNLEGYIPNLSLRREVKLFNLYNNQVLSEKKRTIFIKTKPKTLEWKSGDLSSKLSRLHFFSLLILQVTSAYSKQSKSRKRVNNRK